jgi:transcriptional regulator with XRE-family HTH domain
MPRPRRNTPNRIARRIYLGEWLARLRRKQVDLARAVGITPTYVSELISLKKPNPSPGLLLEISEWLGLTVNDLYRPPPPIGATEAVDKLNPAQLATLGRLLDEIKSTKRR